MQLNDFPSKSSDDRVFDMWIPHTKVNDYVHGEKGTRQ